jgi:dipeptidyl aminopeptidase/acylaminoacyl peptidase
MRTSWIVACALWATAGLALAQQPAAPASSSGGPPPLEAYGRLPALEEVQISPDGKHLAYVTTDGDQRLLLVADGGTGKVETVIKTGRIKLRGLQWADDRRLLIITSTTGEVLELTNSRNEWRTVQVFDIVTRKQRPLLANIANSMNVVLSEPAVRQIHGKTWVFLQTRRFEEADGTEALYRVDLDSGTPVMVSPGRHETEDWFVDRDGRPAAEARYVTATGEWSLWINQPKGGWTLSRKISAPIDEPSIMGYAKDGRSLLVHTLEDHQEMFHTVSLEDGSWGPAEPDGYSALIFDDTSYALIGGVSLDGDRRRVDFFDPATAAIWKAIEQAYPDERVHLASWTRDHRKVVVLVDGLRDGYAYALDDLDAKSGEWLGAIYPMLSQEQIAQPKPITYKAADGLEIPAYLTLPVGSEGKNLPLIVYPHGGPEDRDTLDFDWLREALASRGYAVLQPNFRGSSGYKDAFLAAGYGQWGRKMQTDLSDGVRYLAAQGIVDPKRVCIFGWSYGGYAALAGAALDPGIYRCAADMAGPSDIQLIVQQAQGTDGRDNDTLRYFKRYLGVNGPSDPVLPQISPARHAAKVGIPILIVHGKDDTVVDYQQSLIMADALKRAGKPYSFVTLDGEDHWGSRGETRLKLLQAVMEFLIKNNPPDS